MRFADAARRVRAIEDDLAGAILVEHVDGAIEMQPVSAHVLKEQFAVAAAALLQFQVGVAVLAGRDFPVDQRRRRAARADDEQLRVREDQRRDEAIRRIGIERRRSRRRVCASAIVTAAVIRFELKLSPMRGRGKQF